MTADLTIAIISAVEPPLPECLAAVEAQEGGPYRVIYIKNIFPMSVAFNAMILSTDARYVVQVDGDVALKPWAVRRLYEAIQKAWWCYAAFGQLYEDGFGLGGAVRIWRRWPVKLLGFRDVRCVDRDLHHRMRFLGMRRLEVLGRMDQSITEASETFGTHFPRNAPLARFSKAKGDALKWLHLGRTDLHEAFRHKLRGDYRQETFPERLGLYAASISTTQERSKNLQEDWWEYQTLCGTLPMDFTI